MHAYAFFLFFKESQRRRHRSFEQEN